MNRQSSTDDGYSGSQLSANSNKYHMNNTLQKNVKFRASNYNYNTNLLLMNSLSKDISNVNNIYYNNNNNMNNSNYNNNNMNNNNNNNNNLPIFINKPSKKQLISINGLFDSAIIPIKYNQIQRAQTDSTNRSPFKY